MKVTQEKPAFRPVTITLETLEDVKYFAKMLAEQPLYGNSYEVFSTLKDIEREYR